MTLYLAFTDKFVGSINGKQIDYFEKLPHPIKARVNSLVMSVTLPILNMTTITLISADLMVKGMLSRQFWLIKKGLADLGVETINSIGLFILGIIGTINPITANRLAEKIGDFFHRKQLCSCTTMELYKNPEKFKLGNISKRIASPIQGVVTLIKALTDFLFDLIRASFQINPCQTMNKGVENLSKKVIFSIALIKTVITGQIPV